MAARRADHSPETIRLGLMSPRGERAVLTVPSDTLMRLTCNPFYSYSGRPDGRLDRSQIASSQFDRVADCLVHRQLRRVRLGRGRHQREGDDLLDLGDVVDRQLLAQFLGQILVDVLLVLPRQDHFVDPVTPGGEDLFLDPADRQHPARQRDFAGHADVAANRTAGQLRGQGGHHRDAGRRPVLRNGAGRARAGGSRNPCRTTDRPRSASRWCGTRRAPSAPTPSSRRRGGRSASGCRRPACGRPRRTALRRRPASTPDRPRRRDPWCGSRSLRRGTPARRASRRRSRS